MTPYFFKQMRKRTSLCLVVVLTALAFSLALCMLQRSRDQMAARIEEVYDHLEVRCSVTNLTGTQSDQLNLPDWVLRLFDGEKTYGNFQDNDLFAPYVRDVQVRSTVYCTTPGDQDRLTLSGVTGLKADSSLLASSGCTVIWREGFGRAWPAMASASCSSSSPCRRSSMPATAPCAPSRRAPCCCRRSRRIWWTGTAM